MEDLNWGVEEVVYIDMFGMSVTTIKIEEEDV